MKKRFLTLFLFVLAFKFMAQNHYVVTSNGDTNPMSPAVGELRWAMEQANANPGLDYIDFNIPTLVAPIVIQPQTDLPSIIDPVIINGSTQPLNGYTGPEPPITMDGINASGSVCFYQHAIGNCTIENLTIKNFLVAIYEEENPVAPPTPCGNNNYLNNVIVSCFDGFRIFGDGGSPYNQFKGNYFGTDHSLISTPSNYLGYYIGGVYQSFGSAIWLGRTLSQPFNPTNNIIGGPNPNDKNYFYGNQVTSAIRMETGNEIKIENNIFIGNGSNIGLNYGGPFCSKRNNCKPPPVFLQTFTFGISGTSAAGDYIEIYKSNSGGIDAIQLLGTVTADASGNWNITVLGLSSGDYINATATDFLGNTSEFTPAQVVTIPPCCTNFLVSATNFQITSTSTTGQNTQYTGTACLNAAITFDINGSSCSSNQTYVWNFGDGSANTTGSVVSHAYTTAGTYDVSITIQGSSCISTTQNYYQIQLIDCCCSNPVIGNQVANIASPGNCTDAPIIFAAGNCPGLGIIQGTTFNWNFGDGTTGTGPQVIHSYPTAGTYNTVLTLTIPGCSTIVANESLTISLCDVVACNNCIGSFAPDPGDYIISVWVREDWSASSVGSSVYTYTNSGVSVSFVPPSTTYNFIPNSTTDPIIEGWQRIEGKFTVPAGATNMNISLNNNNTTSINTYFDDIRVHPFNGNMKTYVYDPITLRLAAELDENNYATLYEYDEEGKLIRVKKETQRGVMTIKESRSSNKKSTP
jgi:PKD repeat protein